MHGVDTLEGAQPTVTRSATSERGRAQALIARYERDVHRLVGHLLGPDPDHDDVVQDVFVRLMVGQRTLREPERERSWVVTVTVNQVRNHLRRRRVRRIVELRPAPPEQPQAAEPGLLARDLARRGYRLLDRLRPDDRIVVVLRRIEDRSLEEVAAVCGCSTATVKRRLRRGEARLDKLLALDPDLYRNIRGEEGTP